MAKQIAPCPQCGFTAGWWSPLTKFSMVFYDADGCKLEHRLFEKPAKHCANCDAKITKLIED